MATEAATEDHRQQATDIDLSPSAKMGIIMSLRASGLGSTIHQLTLTGPDYEHLNENWSFHVSSYYRRYFQSYELRMTLEALLTGDFETLLEAAFDESREQLLFRSTFPHPEFLQSLVEKFMASENPRSLRRIQLIKIGQLPEAGLASFHFPRAYDALFPCTCCTVYRAENETDLSVEVFHFANRKDTSVCATVSFRMSVDHVTKHIYTMDSQIEFTGKDPTVVTIAMSRWSGEYEQLLRVLVPRSPEQLSWMLREHLRYAIVTLRFLRCEDSFQHQPQGAKFHRDELKTLGWTLRLFQSIKRTKVERVKIDAEVFGVDNIPTLMNAARFSCRVGTFDLVYDDFIVTQVIGLLNDPSAVASEKIVLRTV
ncbi:hypothetical protein AAVH_08921 [Aphelenchoides avenae]|nr:hypothetical protein AAVH_08921 [Aphelenchus avenae]